MHRLMDVNGECPACGRRWKEPQVGAVSQVVRLYRLQGLRGFQCPSCATKFTPAGEMIIPPRPGSLDPL